MKSCTWLQLSSVSSADARFFLFPTASAAKTWRSASVNTPEIMGVDFLGGCQAATICTFSYRLEAIHGLLFLEASTDLPSPMEPLVNITIGEGIAACMLRCFCANVAQLSLGLHAQAHIAKDTLLMLTAT